MGMVGYIGNDDGYGWRRVAGNLSLVHVLGFGTKGGFWTARNYSEFQ